LVESLWTILAILHPSAGFLYVLMLASLYISLDLLSAEITQLLKVQNSDWI